MPRAYTASDMEILPPGDRAADTRDIEALARWLDTKWAIPGSHWRFGLDSVIGLVPGIGDGITALLGAYIILRARDLGAPPLLLARMGANLGADALLGAIPLVGDVFDFAFKSHARNLRLLQRHLERARRVESVISRPRA